MKKIYALLILSLVASGCALIGGGGEADPRWADYKDWTKLNNTSITGDHSGFLGGLHEGSNGVREVYINDVGLNAASGAAPYNYPVGTVILKEQYSSQRAVDSGRNPGITVMVKVSDDAANPAENWAWSRGYTRTARVSDGFCSGCHTIAAASDYAFSNAESLADFR